MDRRAIIATHHKTGSVWMNTTFREICARTGLPFVTIGPDSRIDPDHCAPPVVVSDIHSKFRRCRWILKDDSARIFHLIRDPRDVVISGMHYHRTSREKWLFVSRDKFGGTAYQAKLNSLPTELHRLVFEMDHAGGNTIRRMAQWDYRQSNSFECKYEDLIRDVEGTLFVRVAAHLGFAGEEIELCRRTFWDLAIFGGRAGGKRQDPHIRSGEGGQWRSVFDRATGEEFLARFGDVLVRLGYEQDNAWLDRLPRTVPRRHHGRDAAAQSILDGT